MLFTNFSSNCILEYSIDPAISIGLNIIDVVCLVVYAVSLWLCADLLFWQFRSIAAPKLPGTLHGTVPPTATLFNRDPLFFILEDTENEKGIEHLGTYHIGGCERFDAIQRGEANPPSCNCEASAILPHALEAILTAFDFTRRTSSVQGDTDIAKLLKELDNEESLAKSYYETISGEANADYSNYYRRIGDPKTPEEIDTQVNHLYDKLLKLATIIKQKAKFRLRFAPDVFPTWQVAIVGVVFQLPTAEAASLVAMTPAPDVAILCNIASAVFYFLAAIAVSLIFLGARFDRWKNSDIRRAFGIVISSLLFEIGYILASFRHTFTWIAVFSVLGIIVSHIIIFATLFRYRNQIRYMRALLACHLRRQDATVKKMLARDLRAPALVLFKTRRMCRFWATVFVFLACCHMGAGDVVLMERLDNVTPPGSRTSLQLTASTNVTSLLQRMDYLQTFTSVYYQDGAIACSDFGAEIVCKTWYWDAAAALWRSTTNTGYVIIGAVSSSVVQGMHTYLAAPPAGWPDFGSFTVYPQGITPYYVEIRMLPINNDGWSPIPIAVIIDQDTREWSLNPKIAFALQRFPMSYYRPSYPGFKRVARDAECTSETNNIICNTQNTQCIEAHNMFARCCDGKSVETCPPGKAKKCPMVSCTIQVCLPICPIPEIVIPEHKCCYNFTVVNRTILFFYQGEATFRIAASRTKRFVSVFSATSGFSAVSYSCITCVTIDKLATVMDAQNQVNQAVRMELDSLVASQAIVLNLIQQVTIQMERKINELATVVTTRMYELYQMIRWTSDWVTIVRAIDITADRWSQKLDYVERMIDDLNDEIYELFNNANADRYPLLSRWNTTALLQSFVPVLNTYAVANSLTSEFNIDDARTFDLRIRQRDELLIWEFMFYFVDNPAPAADWSVFRVAHIFGSETASDGYCRKKFADPHGNFFAVKGDGTQLLRTNSRPLNDFFCRGFSCQAAPADIVYPITPIDLSKYPASTSIVNLNLSLTFTQMTTICDDGEITDVFYSIDLSSVFIRTTVIADYSLQNAMTGAKIQGKLAALVVNVLTINSRVRLIITTPHQTWKGFLGEEKINATMLPPFPAIPNDIPIQFKSLASNFVFKPIDINATLDVNFSPLIRQIDLLKEQQKQTDNAVANAEKTFNSVKASGSGFQFDFPSGLSMTAIVICGVLCLLGIVIACRVFKKTPMTRVPYHVLSSANTTPQPPPPNYQIHDPGSIPHAPVVTSGTLNKGFGESASTTV